MSTSPHEGQEAQPEKSRSVPDQILENFFDALVQEAEVSDTAIKLRKLILEDHTISETAIKSAILEEEA